MAPNRKKKSSYLVQILIVWRVEEPIPDARPKLSPY